MKSETNATLFQTGRISNILLILLACLVTYLNATAVGFLALDDLINLKKFFLMDFSIKELFSLVDNRFFRPLVLATFLFDSWMFGQNPGMFHLVNLLIHICNVLLVYHLAFELLGHRVGNFAVQNADLVLVIGSRLSVSSTGHEHATFAREAKLVVVDIDPVEHRKNTVRIDQFVNADAGRFLDGIELLYNYNASILPSLDIEAIKKDPFMQYCRLATK